MTGIALTPGCAEGELVVLDEALSFWGGSDVKTGVIVDPRHPQFGRSLAGAVVALPDGRGSSSSTSVLAEQLRLGVAPVAALLRRPDPIVVLAAIVAAELYGLRLPVVLLGDAQFQSLTGPARVRVVARDGGAEAEVTLR